MLITVGSAEKKMPVLKQPSKEEISLGIKSPKEKLKPSRYLQSKKINK